jgi:hypothetical protein
MRRVLHTAAIGCCVVLVHDVSSCMRQEDHDARRNL